jgi:ornithine--oxo-acid transaminase
MKKTKALIETVEKFGAHNYQPLPVVLDRASGARVWDVEGKEYLDFLSCYSALNFGHQHPVLVGALITQLEKLAVCSRAFHSEELCLFSEELARATGMDMVLPMNSGAEAVETAIKVARKWGYEKKGVPAGKAKIIAVANNFHGRTVTIVSFSSEPAYRDGFGPFTPGFTVIPFDDLKAMEGAIDEHTVAVLLEPIQAEAGILVPRPGYLAGVRKLCEQNRVLLIADEIQTGLGRTGRNFCYEHEGAKPDLLILGKSLGGGLLPISATVGRRDVMEVIAPGQHGSTFGGNPLACSVARAALKLLHDERLSDRAAHLGRIAMEELNRTPLPHVKEIRGKGFLIGIELDPSSGGARRYCERLAEQGVLCKETHTYVIRIAPPLVTSEEDLRRGLEKVVGVIRAFG